LLVSLISHLLSLAGPLLVGRTVDAYSRTAKVGVAGLVIAAFVLVALQPRLPCSGPGSHSCCSADSTAI
jgi:hypothetical protein